MGFLSCVSLFLVLLPYGCWVVPLFSFWFIVFGMFFGFYGFDFGLLRCCFCLLSLDLGFLGVFGLSLFSSVCRGLFF